MSLILNGDDAIIYVYRSGVAIPVSCENSWTIEEVTELIEVTTVGDGANRRYKAGFLDATVSIEGLVTFDQTSKWQLLDFVQNERVEQRIKLEQIDSAGNSMVYDMFVMVESWNNSNPAGDFSQFSVSMKRNGPMTITINGSTGGGSSSGFDYTFDFDID